MQIIPALNAIGGSYRYVKDGASVEFDIIGFGVSDAGVVEKILTFPSVPKGARIEQHKGVHGWAPASLEV